VVSAGDRAVVLIRPEDMSVATNGEQVATQQSLAGVVKDISYHGDTFKLDIAVGDDALKVKVAREAAAGMEPGRPVFLTWKPAAVRILPVADSEHGAPQ
jgi:ABC-type Fe3+/spermidine/putrescine transport system ATPase subunit